MANPKILIVDDNPTMRQMLHTRLERANYEVMEAFNGETALTLAKTHLPDIILCDLMMPDIHGYEVLRQLQEDPATAKIPFIAITAAYHALSKPEGLAKGATDVVQKPVPFEELLNLLNKYLNN